MAATQPPAQSDAPGDSFLHAVTERLAEDDIAPTRVRGARLIAIALILISVAVALFALATGADRDFSRSDSSATAFDHVEVVIALAVVDGAGPAT